MLDAGQTRHDQGMSFHVRVLAVAVACVLLGGVATAMERQDGERPVEVSTGVGSGPESSAPDSTAEVAAAETTSTTASTPTTRATRGTTATTAVRRTQKVSSASTVPMPPGPFTPRVLPAGYVPRLDDGWVNRSPDQPQVSDPITKVPGQPFTFQGRVTDDAGNLLAGICVEVQHSGFGPKVITGADGIFRFVADPEAEPRPALGVWVDLWDCTPGTDPGWFSLRTPISNLLTPGDTSTWFFRLMKASRLEGVIVDDATGNPVAGMCAETNSGGTPGWPPHTLRSAPTDASGRFSLAPIAPWDTAVKAVPCGATGWSGIEARFPFRNGTTLTGTLRAVAPWTPPPGYSGPDMSTVTLPPGGPGSVGMPPP